MVDLLVIVLETWGASLEVRLDLGRVVIIIGVSGLEVTFVLHNLLALPLLAHVVDLRGVVGFRVVVLPYTTHAFPEGKMLWVDSNTMIVRVAASAKVLPAALLFLEIETGGVWKEEEGEEHAGETEPWDDVELGLDIDVGVENGSEKGSKLTSGSGETMCSSADWSWVDLGSDQEGDGVWTELVEERGEEVHGLEGVDAGGRVVVVVVESWNDKEDEVEQETDLHHHLASVELIVDEEGGHVVTSERYSNVDQVPQPAGHDIAAGAWRDDGNKLRLEELVSIEENIVTEPGTGGREDARSEVSESELKRINIVPGDVGILLGLVELSGGEWHLVGSVVNKPKGTDSWDGEGNAENPLDGEF